MIRLYDFDEVRPEEILNRDIRAEADVEATVNAIIADVRARGDAALIEYAAKFDHAELTDVRVSQEEIDEINILQATFLAMRRAMEQLNPQPEFALIDGNRETDFGLPVQTIVKGDSLSANIAAASILAKVTRDRFMLEMDEKYPQYGFATHKGYGTRAHYAALREFGPCPIHRRTFLKNLHAE